MGVDSKAVSLVIFPVSLVDVAVCMDQTTLSIGLITLPEALINAAIWPDLLALTVTLVCHCIPLSLVLGLVLEDLNGPRLSLYVIAWYLSVLVWPELLLNLHCEWVVVVRLDAVRVNEALAGNPCGIDASGLLDCVNLLARKVSAHGGLHAHNE